MGGSKLSSTDVLEAFSAPTILKPQKSFAMAFAALTLALAGCASGLGASHDRAASIVSRVEEGIVIASRGVGENSVEPASFAYTVKLSSGELISIAQDGRPPISDGASVVVEYGQHTRIVPQGLAIS
jgi:hypothetical protein